MTLNIIARGTMGVRLAGTILPAVALLRTFPRPMKRT
jgi:hypothetical protein